MEYEYAVRADVESLKSELAHRDDRSSTEVTVLISGPTCVSSSSSCVVNLQNQVDLEQNLHLIRRIRSFLHS